MKKLIIVSTIMVMALAMAMPCFAAEDDIYINGYEIPNFRHLMNDEKYPYVFVYYANGWGGSPALIRTEHPYRERYDDFYGTHTLTSCVYELYIPSLGPDGIFWKCIEVYDWPKIEDHYIKEFLWANYDIYEGYNKIFTTYDVFVPGPITFDRWAAVYSKFTEQITVKNVVSVLAIGAGALVGIVFMWWGVRKLSRAVLSAFRKGKISV